MSSNATQNVLGGLKDFQRATVEYVFDRLYQKPGSGRFLVADEVGLGKTLVARGVIAKAIDHLRDKVKRIDVVYICSNGDIARQNINRLRVGDEEHFQLVSRLTLLPRERDRLENTKTGVNFISFTPATSFDLHSGLGRSDERVLLYWILRKEWAFGASKAAVNVFQGASGAESFRNQIQHFDPASVANSQNDFHQALDVHPKLAELRAQFDSLCAAYARSDSLVSDATKSARYRFIGEMRSVLAASCVRALEPDLIILDEFQRFSHVLHGEDDASELARKLFDYPDVRVLLLSATPYKMYTTADETTDDHYADFVRTVGFLERRDDASLEQVVRAYGESIIALGERARGDTAVENISSSCRALEDRLRGVMVRTERLAATADRNGMLVEMPARPMRVLQRDLHDYLTTQRVARAVDSDDTIELWKSSPFVLNFADEGYKLRREIDAALETADGRAQIARALVPSPTSTISWPDVERYKEIDCGNARMRALVDDVVESGAWRTLWITPSLPYYKLAGAFGVPSLASFTKRLVFSSWRLVPRSIAALLSYEVDRRMLAGDDTARNTPEARKARRGLLRFSNTSDGRLTGMPVLALMYPSIYLARACDPGALLAERARERADEAARSVETIALDDVLTIARTRIGVALARLGPSTSEGAVDERWYWAAPILLDRSLDDGATRAWFLQTDLAKAWAGDDDGDDDDEAQSSRTPNDESSAWERHVEQARGVALGAPTLLLGRQPDDLVDVLAELAVAGPAVAMFRALDRVVGSESHDRRERLTLRNGAARTAWSFRALFNRSSVTWMLRGGERGRTEVPYWREVLRYCADGCLAAVLDEYVHVLRDHLGLVSGSLGHRVLDIAKEIRDALELRPGPVTLDDYVLSDSGRTVRSERRTFVTQYAARFADQSNDDGTATRPDQIRKAFNSPFWPFVLATTSVGQEGLDFHTYCHAVVHWNLPSNPVDLEQREGRVHRFKGHAVRRNVATLHGWSALESDARDVWESMFVNARDASRAQGSTEIVPFWVYPIENGAHIERHILSLPLSREHGHAAALRKSLAVYRMVFGQPRQDDLVRYILENVPPDQLQHVLETTRIDLGPRLEPSAVMATQQHADPFADSRVFNDGYAEWKSFDEDGTTNESSAEVTTASCTTGHVDVKLYQEADPECVYELSMDRVDADRWTGIFRRLVDQRPSGGGKCHATLKSSDPNQVVFDGRWFEQDESFKWSLLLRRPRTQS